MTKKKNPNLSLREALIEAWKDRADYKGYDKTKGSPYNSWRSITNTKKGKQIGFPSHWRDYDKFMEDVQWNWQRGYVAIRIDTTKPHSKENTFWARRDETYRKNYKGNKMATITQKDLLEKYGISLSKGKYDIEVADGKYKIYTVQDDTEGCILVGLNKTKGAVIDSQATFNFLMARLPTEFEIKIE